MRDSMLLSSRQNTPTPAFFGLPDEAPDRDPKDIVSGLGQHLPQVVDGATNASQSMTKLDDGSSGCKTEDDEDEGKKASQNIDLASSLMAECKAELSLSDLDSAIFLFREVLSQRPIAHPGHFEARTNLASALGVRFMYTDQMNDLIESLAFRRRILDSFSDGQPESDTTIPLSDDLDEDDGSEEVAKACVRDFQTSSSLPTINTLVLLLQNPFTLHPPTQDERFTALKTLADGLYARFHHSYCISDLDNAISSLQDAVGFYPQGDPRRLNALHRLCIVFTTRFDFAGNVLDLQRAFSLFADGHLAEFGAPWDRNFSPIRFAQKLQVCEELQESLDGLNRIIALFRQVKGEISTGDHDYPSVSYSLAAVLTLRYKKIGQQCELDEVISLYREILELLHPPHPDRLAIFPNFITALLLRARQVDQCDLEQLGLLSSQANDLPPFHPYRSFIMERVMGDVVACAMLQNPEEVGSLTKSVSEYPYLSDPVKQAIADNLLGIGEHLRHDQSGQLYNLDNRISLIREDLKLIPPLHSNRYGPLLGLAALLSEKFKKRGERGDLDEAILLGREALVHCPTPHHNRHMALHCLARTLLLRYEDLGASPSQLEQDLNEMVLLHREALELCPLDERNSHLSALGDALGLRGMRGRRQDDLDEAISCHRPRVEKASKVDRHAAMDKLAFAISCRFQLLDQLHDLNEAISLYRDSIELVPPLHPSRCSKLNGLAKLLTKKFRKTSQQCDIDEAILSFKQVIETRHPPYLERPIALCGLGCALVDAHPLNGNNSDYLEQAMSSFFAGTQYAPQSASHRLRIAKEWIKSANLYRHTSSIDAYGAALEALPQLAALSFDIQSRQEALTDGSDGLARDASSCAIGAGSLDKAIEFLEAGRTIFWSQALSLRTPLDKIHDIAPELADQLRNIATALELGSHRNIFSETVSSSDNCTKIEMEEEVSRMHRLGKEWSRGIDEVRCLKGFEDFLRPRRFSSLQAAAAECPVVILIANDDSSHCLIMTLTSVHHIPLLSLPTNKLRRLVYLIQAAASRSHTPRSSIDSQEIEVNSGALPAAIRAALRSWIGQAEKRGTRYANKVPSDDIFRSCLEVLWNEIVKPVINFLCLQKSEEPPVLRWCPTGLFTFLPIHAAGCYDPKPSIECASDYIVSSYTPTIGVLLDDNGPDPPSGQDFKMTVVVDTKGLNFVQRELNKIKARVPNDSLVLLGLPDAPAHIEVILSLLSTSSVVHFACHGKQDKFKPLNSALFVDDGRLEISRIIQQPLPNGSLAFLSACETAMGDSHLPDEAMSLGASLLFSGFRHVIATMWEMRDEDGPTIVDTFYEELFQGPDGNPAQRPDTTKSSRALHIAVKKLRTNPDVSFHRWVPFVHMG